MSLYIVQRLGTVAAILLAMSLLVFLAIHALPGNTAAMILGQYKTPEALAALTEKLGLNEPLHVQYWLWLSNALSGDLGDSLVMERPVAPLLWEAIRQSAILALASLACVALVGIVLGVISAVHRGRLADHAISILTYVGISIPEFLWGLILLLVFGGWLNWLPTSGAGELSEGLWPFLSHLILPVATLTLTLVAHVSRLTRSSMIDVLQSNYVRAVRARGVPERRVLYNHALRNGLLPSITVIAQDFGWLIGGIVVIESIFAYPGVGRLLVFALNRQDMPVVQATVLVITAIYCLANLAADISYAALNPQIRYGRAVA